MAVEKLTNKIFRSFALDIAFIVPFLLFIGIQYRIASEQVFNEEKCYEGLAAWLLSYFIFMTTFAFIKVIRVCVLRTLPHQYYFYYVCLTTSVYWIAMFLWFIVGNFTFFKSLSYKECTVPGSTDGKETEYNALPLQILTGIILVLYWFFLLAVYQIGFFTFMLWALWRGVVRAAQKMQ